MKVAYLINQYPKISHVFIRREILAVEREGIDIVRIAIRRSSDAVVDPVDIEEQSKTHTLLDAGWLSLLHATLRTAIMRPKRFIRGLTLTVSVGRRSRRGLAMHLVYLAEACLLERWATRDRIQHIHAHFGTNSATVAMLCHEIGGPSYSITVHGPEEFDDASLLGLRQKIRRSAFIAAITSYARSQLYRLCDFRCWSKIKLVRCGVDAQFFGPEPVAIPDQRRLISIGRLSEQKGQLLLIEALAILQREGRHVDLVLIGDGEMRDEVERAVTRHALVERVHIVGWATGDAVRQALDESCALVLPSFAEGLPVVIMEAFARSRPVLSTFVAGIPELVMPGRNGWLVPAGSVEDLAGAIREILDTPRERLEAMGACGREDAKRLHDVELAARELGAHLRAAVAKQLDERGAG
jgi:colanic acid/amylovoran biosynthesis glycosyltransferase